MESHDINSMLRARQERLRRWADLEGKSPTMRDDLYRQHASHRRLRRNPRRLAVRGGKLLVAALCVWLSGGR